MNRRSGILVLAAALALVALILVGVGRPDPSWQKLRPGQTIQEVQELIGTHPWDDGAKGVTIWTRNRPLCVWRVDLLHDPADHSRISRVVFKRSLWKRGYEVYRELNE